MNRFRWLCALNIHSWPRWTKARTTAGIPVDHKFTYSLVRRCRRCYLRQVK